MPRMIRAPRDPTRRENTKDPAMWCIAPGAKPASERGAKQPLTGDGPPKLGEGPAAARFGDALGGSFAGDQGSLIPFPAAEVGAAEATPPQGSS